MSKYEFALICIIMACIVGCYIFKANKNKNELGHSMMKVLLMGNAVILSYTVTLVCNNYLIMSAGSSGIFISIDWALFFLLDYIFLFVNSSNQKTIGRTSLKVILLIDSFLLMINPWYEFTVGFVTKNINKEIYLLYQPKPWFYFHLFLCYGMIAIIVILLICKCLKIPAVYRSKYSIICFFLIIIAAINGLFLLTNIYIDVSILSYALISCVIYHFTFDYKQTYIINKTRALIVESMASPAILFDYEENLCIVNQSGEMVFKFNSMEKQNRILTSFIESQFSKNIQDKEKNICFETTLNVNSCSRWFRVDYDCLKDKSQQYLGSLFVLNDITDHKKMLEKLEYAANYDYLTGVYNRNILPQFYDGYINKLPLGVVLWNLNGLHLINDFYGIEIGDCVICRVVEIIKENLKKVDILARWNGDEFLILLPDQKEEEIVHLMNEIQKKITLDKKIGVDISAEFGVAFARKVDISLNECLAQSRKTMYQKKLLNQKSVRSSILESLKKSLSESDYETEEHAERTKKMAIRLGEKLGLSDRNLGELGLLAILHDIGKVSIPDSILLKPDKLTEDEWIIMKNHTVKGYEIARITTELETIAKYILHHHERWDGNGYPEKLNGTNIPLLSRIISVVDSYDVMTHNRPYHTAITKEESIAELRRCKGTQFDPDIVESFIDLITEEQDVS